MKTHRAIWAARRVTFAYIRKRMKPTKPIKPWAKQQWSFQYCKQMFMPFLFALFTSPSYCLYYILYMLTTTTRFTIYPLLLLSIFLLFISYDFSLWIIHWIEMDWIESKPMDIQYFFRFFVFVFAIWQIQMRPKVFWYTFGWSWYFVWHKQIHLDICLTFWGLSFYFNDDLFVCGVCELRWRTIQLKWPMTVDGISSDERCYISSGFTQREWFGFSLFISNFSNGGILWIGSRRRNKSLSPASI